MKDIDIKFGQFDCDIQAAYTLEMTWYIDKSGTHEFLKDEIRFVTSANVKTESDIAYIEVLKNEMLLDS